MLFISIMLIVWFGFWLYFAYQKNAMMQVITSIMIDSVETSAELQKEGD